MTNTYYRYPTNGVPKYATFSALPAGAASGDVAITIDTDNLYAFNGTMWVQIGGPGEILGIGTLDGNTPSPDGASIASAQLFMQSASASNAGLVNTIGQTFTGIKNFSNNIFAANLSGTNSGDVTIGTANGLSLSGQVLSLALASTSTTGALSSADWNTFNGKQPAGSYVTSVSVTTANGVSGTSSGGTTPSLTLTLGAITPSSVAASGSVTGSNLSGTNTGDVTIGTANGLSLAGQALSLATASTSTTGALTSADWNTFNGKQAAGTYLTSASVTTANGVSATTTGGTTPAFTFSLGAITPTSVNGNTVTTGTGTLTLSTFTVTAAANATISGTNTGDQTGVSAPTASTIVGRDTNANSFFNSAGVGFTQVTGTGGTTTLTAASSEVQQLITGGQTFMLPNATTLTKGQVYEFINRSGNNLIVVNTASGAVCTVPNQCTGWVTASTVATSAGTWDAVITVAAVGTPTGTGNIVYSASPTLTGTTNVSALTASGTVTNSGITAYSRTDDASTGAVNNLTTAGRSYIRFTGAGTIALNGAAAGVDGQVIWCQNSTGNTITLFHSSVSATGAVFLLASGVAKTITNFGCFGIIYDGGGGQWHYIGSNVA